MQATTQSHSIFTLLPFRSVRALLCFTTGQPKTMATMQPQEVIDDAEYPDEMEYLKNPNEAVQKQESYHLGTIDTFIKAAKQASDLSVALDPEIRDDCNETSTNCLEARDGNWQWSFYSGPPSYMTDNPLLSAFTDPTNAAFSPYAQSLNSYDELIQHLLRDEMEQSDILHGGDVRRFKEICRGILYPMDTRVIHSLIRGDLPRVARTDTDVKKVLDHLFASQAPTIAEPKFIQPSIYIQYIVTRGWSGLTAAQRARLTHCLKHYCHSKDHDYALKVDSVKFTGPWTLSNSRSGLRKYLMTKNNSKQNDDRRIQGRRFLHQVRQPHPVFHSK